jgi:hypothetical protein
MLLFLVIPEGGQLFCLVLLMFSILFALASYKEA